MYQQSSFFPSFSQQEKHNWLLFFRNYFCNFFSSNIKYNVFVFSLDKVANSVWRNRHSIPPLLISWFYPKQRPLFFFLFISMTIHHFLLKHLSQCYKHWIFPIFNKIKLVMFFFSDIYCQIKLPEFYNITNKFPLFICCSLLPKFSRTIYFLLLPLKAKQKSILNLDFTEKQLLGGCCSATARPKPIKKSTKF